MSKTSALCLGFGSYVDKRAALFAFGEDNCTVNESVESVVFAHTHVQARVVNSTTLTFEDVACLSLLATENFHTESCGFLRTAGV